VTAPIGGSAGGIGGIGGNAAGVRDIIALRQQIIDRSSLLQQLHAPASGTPAVAQQPGAPPTGFSGALQNALHQVSATQNNADQITDAYQRGEVTDVSKVMLAREQSGVAFEATLQVKSRLLNAYQDIMRMGV
jgi:flagellar hook-basal body complex protein FliE